MKDAEVRVAAALHRLAEVASDGQASGAELDAAVAAAFGTPGVGDELLKRARQAEEQRSEDDEPAA